MKTDTLPYAPHRDTTLSIEKRVSMLLSQMTLAEKIGQMTQAEKNSLTPQDVNYYRLGSVLSGGGGNPTPNNATAWREMVVRFQEQALKTRLGIPLLYGVDAVHGHNNMFGATIFPHNIGLGATRNRALVSRIAEATGKETLAVGVHWDFAPAVSVPQDIRWGRTYEGYSENTELVSELGAAYVRGLQRNDLGDPHSVLASVKHFAGDGGTTWGTTYTPEWIQGVWRGDENRWQIDQGDTRVDEATLRRVHLAPYQAAIAAGARNIMVSYSSWNGQKMHGHHYLLTRVLKEEFGFTGFLVSDWLAINPLNADYYTCVVTAINAGLDMIMVPFDYPNFISTLTKAVANRDVSMIRIDDAVRRILRVKLEMNLFERPYGDETLLASVGSDSHRAVARQAVRESLVLLKNEGNIVPLRKETPELRIAGDAADDLGLQCGGWTIEWTGRRGAITTGTTFLAALHDTLPDTAIAYAADANFEENTSAEVGIVVLSEPTYAEGEGDSKDLSLTDAEIDLVQRMRAQHKTLIVILYSGRPRPLGLVADLADVIIAAWLPGTEGAGVTDVLFGDYPFTGKLSYTWPLNMEQVAAHERGEGVAFPFGYGLSTK